MKKLKKKVLLIYLIKNRIPDIYRLQKTQKTIIHFFDDAYDSFSELLENLIGLKFILEVILNKILFIDILVTPSKPPSKKNNFQKKLTYQIQRYTAINWFPKSLLIQFMKSANIYFLIITVLTAMPFSPKVFFHFQTYFC